MSNNPSQFLNHILNSTPTVFTYLKLETKIYILSFINSKEPSFIKDLELYDDVIDNMETFLSLPNSDKIYVLNLLTDLKITHIQRKLGEYLSKNNDSIEVMNKIFEIEYSN